MAGGGRGCGGRSHHPADRVRILESDQLHCNVASALSYDSCDHWRQRHAMRSTADWLRCRQNMQYLNSNLNFMFVPVCTCCPEQAEHAAHEPSAVCADPRHHAAGALRQPTRRAAAAAQVRSTGFTDTLAAATPVCSRECVS